MPPPHAEQEYLENTSKILNAAKSDHELFETIVNAPFHDPTHTTLLGLGIVVLLLVNPRTQTIDRIALSKTGPARGAVRMSAKPFKDIRIPLDHEGNVINRVIKTGQYEYTSDWQYLFAPELSPQEARFNQAGAGIECSFVYPLGARDGGALIYSYYEPSEKIQQSQKSFMTAYSRAVTDALTA